MKPLMIHFTWYSFVNLSVTQLYAILQLRADVFVVEQHCPYLDPDGKDLFALHLLGTLHDNTLAAYIRLFPPTDIEPYLVFGRVVTRHETRTQGFGKQLMQALLAYCDTHYPGITIKCSAQHYLQQFYQSFGFKTHGDIYQEDRIPHIAMQKNA
jgi:ElaA protein